MARKDWISTGLLAASATVLGLAIAGVPAAGQPPGPEPFVAGSSSGWSAQDRETWYWSSQGSRMMPLSWFMALEQAGSRALFSDEGNLAGFGFIPAPAGRQSRLPIGFAVDRQSDDKLSVTQLRWYAGQSGEGDHAEPWVGMNCSACHTAQLSYGGRAIRVDGGPGMGDFDAFVAAADAALEATLADPARFDRFAARVFAAGGADTPGNRASLRSAVASLLAWQKRTAALNRAPVRGGFARVDAFGHIYNKIVLFAGSADPIVNPSDAPVSYPFLWDIGRQKKVQWNGAASNQQVRILGRNLIDIGALGRNSGEVIGVFGEVRVVPASARLGQLAGFPSSLNVLTLDKLERIVGRLKAPAWPALLPAVDVAKAAAGRTLFARHCASCHKTPDLQRKGEPIEVMQSFRQMGPANLTDIWMACNSWSYEAKTGRLQGTRDNFLKGDRLGPRAPVVTMLTATVQGALVGKKHPIASRLFAPRASVAAAAAEGAAPAAASKAERRRLCLTTDHPLLAYKARPLDGIWATAPYLHNGSVPTLYDLLLPAAQRPRSFRLGTRDFDPAKVGYAPMAAGGFLFDTAVEGNSNQGHDYGVGALGEAERWALVEYMKTL